TSSPSPGTSRSGKAGCRSREGDQYVVPAKATNTSFPRRREPMCLKKWAPACAGATVPATRFRLHLRPQVAHADGLALGAGHLARLLDRDGRRHADHGLHLLSHAALELSCHEGGRDRLDLDRHLVHVAAALDDE